MCYSPPLLAGFRCRWWWAAPATPGWGPLAAVVCGVWCVVCGGGVLVGLWLVCGVVGPSPLLAGVPVCYSPPLLAGFRCRWWWLVPRHSWRRFLCATPRHSWLGFASGGGGRSPPLLAGVCRRRWCVVCGGGVLVGLRLVCGVVGPSPLLAEVPVCYSPPLLAGFRCRWWWAVPATPGWGLLAAVVCGVWCVAVVCWWGCGWFVVWLVPRHSWRRFLCATPRHSWLGFAAGGGGRSPPLLAGVRLRRWCVVCGVWRWCVGGVVVGLWCGWSLATPGGGSCVLLPATPGWVSLPVVVCGPRHSWLGSACGGGVWCVVCGGGVLVGLWLVCGVVGPSPLLAEVPVCYSPPLLAGFRCRWWWAVPATPGWGPVAASVCGVWRWCVGGVVAGVWCGWSLATPGGGPCVLLPATPGWVSLPLVVGGPRHSWLGSAGGGGVRALLGRVGRAGLPGAFWCASPFPLAALSFCSAWPPPGWGCPSLFRCCCRSSLAGVCGVWVGCCLAPVRVPWFVACCARSPRLWHPAAVAAWHLSVCLGCGRRRASLACLVAPRGAPRLVRSGRSRCSGRLSRRRGAFPHPGSLRPRLYWAAARGTRRPAENRAHCACRWPPPRQGRWARSASYPFGAPRWGCPWRVPPASVLGCVRCGGWRVWTRSLTRPVSRTVRLSTGDSAGAPGLFRVDADTSPCGSEDATPGSSACLRVLALLGRVGRAGLPGAFWCASPFPLAALSFCIAWPPPGPGCPSLFRCCCCSSLVVFLGLPLLGSRLVCVLRLAVGCSLVVAPPPPPTLCLSCLWPWCFFFFFFFFPPCAPFVSGFLRFPAPGALGLGACVVCFVGLPLLGSPCACPSFVPPLAVGCSRVVAAPPPPLCVPRFLFLPLGAVCRVVLCVPRCGAAPRCCALCRPVLCCRVLCCARLVPLLVAPCPLALPVALGPCALRRCVLRCSPGAVCSVLCVFCRGAVVRAVVRRSALCCVCLGVLCCAFPVLSVLCGAVLRCAGALALCCSCGACCCWRLVLWCAAVCCAVSRGVPWCGAGSGGPWLSARGVFRCRCLCLAAWSASLWLVWFAVVPCFPVSCSVVLCCRVVLCCCALLLCCGAVGACFALLWAVVLCCVVLLVGCAVFGPVVVSACCGALFLALCVPYLLRSVRCGALLCWLWCPASLCRVLWRCAVVWCCAVVLCCRFAVLFVFALPSCGLSCGACVVCAVVGASCCGVSLCVVVSPWAFCGVVVLLWCVVVSCCAVRCPVVSCALCRVLRCRAVLRCCAGWLCCAVVCAAGVCFVLSSFARNPCRFSVPLKTLFFCFFENKIKLYTTQHTRVQQDHVRCCSLRVTRRS